jgi:hypothetical protein
MAKENLPRLTEARVRRASSAAKVTIATRLFSNPCGKGWTCARGVKARRTSRMR